LQVHLAREIERRSPHQYDGCLLLTQVQQRHAGGRRGQQRRKIAQAKLWDVDHVEGRDLDQRAGVPLDGAALRRHCVHHTSRTAAVLSGNVEDVNHRVLDAKVDGFLEAPSHGSAQLRGRHVGRLDQYKLIVAVSQHRADRSARQPRCTDDGCCRVAAARGHGQQLATLEHRRTAVTAHDGDSKMLTAEG
jgi:hypothetical protein